MRDHSRKILIIVLAVGAGLIVSSLFPRGAVARDPVAGVVVPDDYMVGGEPGEDPHLKTKPDIQPILDSDYLGSTAGVTTGDKDIYGIQAVGQREGRGCFRGSRVNLAWRMIFQTWFWTLHR